ncbi:hypothetical protein [Kibdelosporangium phytohabitans]|uniref:Uncharacterized protein n=1 Tax=Kibdelosporangium phytohabitans TaxID=860235 RepID=A0A0N9IBE0_9PSEU|nr:hypothetical protein [Kibdelosporangium phytohabitans]ALG13629.1 hypothetical protein AOZ06_48290 [Kibdelosporangium phytohabitans]MBE1465510.1 hypothetical protein [Kibdelosporangium phytohabitans]
MAVREAGSRSPRGDADGAEAALRSLRARWRTASIAAGWRYPSDWALPEVDAVCASALVKADLADPLADLGRARAVSGAGLDETLTDVAALHAVLSDPRLVMANPDATPARLLRLTALAWADVSTAEIARSEVREGLTGLSTAAYLRTRLGEIYRQASRDERTPGHVLLTVSIDLSAVVGWSRLMAMVLAADVLRQVFDGGESLALLGPSVAVVLTEREPDLAKRCSDTQLILAERLSVDPQLHTLGPVEVRLHRLPATHDKACDLIDDLGRL